MPVFATAASVSDLQKQKDYYADQAKKAAEAAAKKSKEAEEIQSDVAELNSKISNLQGTIDTTQRQISDVQKNIDDLDKQIKQREDELSVEKEKMNKIVASWYMEGEDGLLEAMVGADSLSDLVNKQQYYDSINQQIELQIDRVNEMKSQLDGQKREQTSQLTYLTELKNSQTAQQDSLEQSQRTQRSLLSNTQGAIADYNNQAKTASAKVAQITSEMNKVLCQASGGTWNGSICTYASSGGPSGSGKHSNGGSGPQLNVPYYSQRDDSWSSIKLDGYSMYSFGCLVTSFAMVGSFYGLGTTPRDIANYSYFSDGNFQGFNRSVFSPRDLNGYERPNYNVDWDKVDSQLRNNHPVIAGVRLGANNTHWIVITGGSRSSGYSFNDPYPLSNALSYPVFAIRTFD